MFCVPVPSRDRVYPKPKMLLFLLVVNGLLLLPVISSREMTVALYSRAAFFPNHPTLLGIVGSMFLHAGIWHYVGNSWFLWIFGRKIEACIGAFRFLFFYLLCGVVGNLLFWVTSLHSAVPLVGASGAISGIAGMYFVLFPRDEFDLHIYLGWFKAKTWHTNAKSAVGAWFLEQFVLGLLTGFMRFSSIAFVAHVGGFLAGVLIAFLMKEPELTESQRDAFERATLYEQGEPDPYATEGVEEPSELTTLKLS